MKNFLKKIVYSFNVFGYRRWQPVFETLENICLVGMNMGRGGDLSTSGELSVVKYIRQKEQESPLVIFDVGANVGGYVESVKSIFNRSSLIYAFEPSAKAFQDLTKNIGQNPNIKLHNIGFGNKEETISLFSDNEGSGLASVYKRRLDHFNAKMEMKEEAHIETLDGFCKRNRLDRIDFLKLDVEGHELKVLEGARALLQNRSIKYIQFEFGGCDIDSRTFFQDFYYLLKDRFNLYRVVKDGLYPLKEYNESYERFINTNYFAERKV